LPASLSTATARSSISISTITTCFGAAPSTPSRAWVRRLFSLTNVFDNWQTGQPINDKPRAASLNDVALYTSLESCAQCSGVMSLAGVKQIVYMQNDFTAYKIGNIMYNLANRLDVTDAQGKVTSIPGAPIPIAGSEIGLEEFTRLNEANLEFSKKIVAAGAADPPISAVLFSFRRTASPTSIPRSRHSCAPTTLSRFSRTAAISSIR
jgi:hypothetical protein